MTAVAYSYFRSHIAETLEKADVEPVTITRSDGRNYVLMSTEADADSYLRSSPGTEKRLNDAIARLEAGQFVEVAL
ncbi:MAG: type II toxin-antitoxin system Phd/YefM family antitoxin [Sulfuricellaceae bacterium]|nr:type II toxin-antitoxin system Phd/YefM family antitoxin [Sulfuricellaceae bacterium]